MKEEILNVLKQKNGFVSGQELADIFNVSRTAVWKAITALKKEGYVIESVRRRGYKLDKENDILNERELEFYENIYFSDEMDSTNDTAKKLALDGCPEYTVVVCNQQKNGKGRLGRKWSSPYGVNIYMSMVLFFDADISKVPQTTLVMGIAAAKTIRDITGLDAKIKWPNDVIINGKKVVGILTEMQAETGHILFVVTGIGINVNQVEFDDDIKQKATSLCLECKKVFKRSEIIKALIQNIKEYYAIFCKDGLDALRDEYKALCINIGREVKAELNGKTIIGRAVDISKGGELIIETKDGRLFEIFGGEATLRNANNNYV